MNSLEDSNTEPEFEAALEIIGASGMRELAIIMREAPFGIYVDHPSRGCVYANPALLSIFGLSWSEFRGFGWAKSVYHEDGEWMRRSIEEYEHTRQPNYLTFRVVAEAGQPPKWLNARVHAVLDQDGSHIGSIGITRDVSSEREFLERVEEGQKLEAVGRLSARLAHDINNLLTALIGNTDIVAREVGSELGQTCLENIYSAFEQARYLTGQLLVLSRNHAVAAGFTELDSELLATRRLLESVVGEGVKLKYELSADKACVPLNKAQLGQIVINLLTNAKDALEDHGEVVLSTALSQGRVLLTVSDQGPGMTREVFQQAMEPFFTTKEVGKGTGLGLSTVRSLAETADGSVSIDSEKGRGTRVIVSLPSLEAQTSLIEPRSKQATTTPDLLRILILEDNDAVRQSLAYSLALYGWEVYSAASLAEARKVAGEVGELDVIVVDVMLGDGKGTEFVDELRSSKPALPAVLCSGFSGDALEGRLKNDYTTFVEKPYRAKEIFEAIGKVRKGKSDKS